MSDENADKSELLRVEDLFFTLPKGNQILRKVSFSI